MGLSKEQEDLYKKTMAEVKNQLDHLDEEVEKELQKVRKRLAELQDSKKSLKMVYEGTAKLLGIVAGLVAAVPVGPVNIFVISQTLKRDFLHGLMAGLTAVTLDVAFSFIALAGFFKIKVSLPPHFASYMRAAGAVIIFLL